MIDKELFEKISRVSGMEAGAIYAIVVTESNGSFSWKNGKIPILYERHWAYRFYRKKHGKYAAAQMVKLYPHLINNQSGGYGKFSEQYGKLAQAIKLLGEEIAHLSTSFGAFQIMGFNHKYCGYSSAVDMADSYHDEPKSNQILGFVEFCKNYKNGKLLRAIENRDWDRVACLYNGKNYKKNRYAAKLRTAYAEYYDEVL
jgi:hypothetical protein